MLDASFRVVLDANVLFPFTLRDTLLRAAAHGLFQVYWSEQILDEATRNLIATGRMNEEQAAHLMAAMRRAFPEALVLGYEPLIEAMRNDEKDRHVSAVAVKVGAQLVVTSNLRDFKGLQDGLEAVSPDSFLLSLLDLEPGLMVRLLHEQASALKRPPSTIHGVLASLATITPRFAHQCSLLLP